MEQRPIRPQSQLLAKLLVARWRINTKNYTEWEVPQRYPKITIDIDNNTISNTTIWSVPKSIEARWWGEPKHEQLNI